MNQALKTNKDPKKCLVMAAFAALVIISCLWRFYNLDEKVFWNDEAVSAFRVAGGDIKNFDATIFNGSIVTRDKILKYQKLDNNQSIASVVNSAKEMPEVPPLYYLAGYLCERIFGSSPSVLRALSALLSCLSLPLVFWFCRLAFANNRVALLAVIFTDLSPLQLLFAQEARPYSLLVDCALLSSCFLLKAERTTSWHLWLAYGLMAAIGLWSQLTFLFVLAAQALWLIASFTKDKRLGKFFFALLVTFALFSPWLVVIYQNWLEMSAHLNCYTEQATLSNWLAITVRNLTLSFIDFGLANSSLILLRLPVLLLIAFAFVFLCQAKQPSAARLLLFLAIIPAAAFALPDLMAGGVRFLIPRYQIVPYLALQIMVAYFLAQQIASKRNREKIFWSLVLALLLIGEIASSFSYLTTDTWWNKYGENNVVAIAAYLDKLQEPIVIGARSPMMPGQLWALCWQLKHNVDFAMVIDANLPQESIASSKRPILLYYPTDELLKNLSNRWQRQAKPITPDRALWALMP
jgi:uncharacterized membrane protein